MESNKSNQTFVRRETETLVPGVDFDPPKRGPSNMPFFSPPQLILKLKDGDRMGFATHFYQRNIVAIQATDEAEKSPRQFFIKDGMDWATFLDVLIQKWNQGLSKQIHPAFRLLKPIPPVLMESILTLPEAEKRVVIDSLRNNGFLPPLNELKAGNQPHGILWDEVRSLCLFPKENP
jgi:hypothetical protein